MNSIILKYKNNEISLQDTIKNLDTENYTNKEIKENGIVYTPKYISDYIVKSLNINENETILEPSVGHGVFIFSLIEFMQNKLKKSELKEWFLNKVFGYDIQEKNIKDLKELLIIYFNKIDIDITIDELINFQVKDTLLDSEKFFDIIFGNPPYIRIKNLNKIYADKLKEKYISCKIGNIDIYYAFIEFASRFSKKSSYIVPNSYLTNKFASNLRQLMLNNIYSIINFKEKRVFEKAAINTSIFLLQNDVNSDEYYYKESIEDSFEKIKKIDLNKSITINKKFNINKVYGPIATLRDNIFKNTEFSDLEDTIPFIKLTKVKSKNDIKNNKERIIFPYKNINNKYFIKDEYELGKNTLIYLNGVKEDLNKRDNGNKIYPKFYSYGRTQGLNKLIDNKNCFIIVPGMFNEDYEFFTFNLNDTNGNFLFSSGLIIEINEVQSDKLLLFLNSSDFFNLVKSIGNVKPGKKPYYSISKPILESILF